MAWWRWRKIALIVGLLCVVAPGGIRPAGAADRSWAGGLPAPPMRLGVNPPAVTPALIKAPTAFPTPRGARSSRSCRSWRLMTERLGETFVAARLRNTILPTACPGDQSAASEVRWSWPWDERGLAGQLPPRHVADHGSWSIRCGNAGPRERCAMVQAGPLATSGLGPVGGAPRQISYSTHFVIDAIGAEERVIWRLYLHYRDDGRGRAIDWNAPRGSVELRLGDFVTTTPFSICTRAGCLLELDVRASAEILNRLWDGVPARLVIQPPRSTSALVAAYAQGAAAIDPPPLLTGDITATGLRRALPNLSLLRQREMRSAHDLRPASGNGAAVPASQRSSTDTPKITPAVDTSMESAR